jgi:primosomal protein N' (replication factor Y)
MLYAQVVLSIPVEGPFDYLIPENLSSKIKVGVRVGVSFRTKKMVGYVVKITQKTKIKKLKEILEVIDNSPILDENMLSLTKELSEYYCCSWGEAIDTALPEKLRKGKIIPTIEEAKYKKNKDKPEITLIHDLDGQARWDIYLTSIKESLKDDRAVIVLLPDIHSVLKVKEKISANLDISPALLYREEPQELGEWLKIKNGEAKVIIGTRSGIFAPVPNLGLVIMDEEQDSVYKQDQVPHYHAREVALMRINIEKAKLILGSSAPSLETFYLARQNKIRYLSIPRKKPFPEIKIVDTRRQYYQLMKKDILSKYLKDLVASTFNAQAKTLLFLNQKGFATFSYCRYCGSVLACPRCNINLVYHFKDNILKCHYCNFKMLPPKICPNCNLSYIRYSGAGAEKIESELSRIFPQARIKRLDHSERLDIKDADIFVSGQSVIKETEYSFDLVGVLLIDNSLNRPDLRASEKTFSLLVGLLNLTEKNLVIQTNLAGQHCFKAIENKNMSLFYEKELTQRKELDFPPYKHLGLVKLRGKNESKVKEISNTLFNKLCRYNRDKKIKIISVNPGQPAKLRGNFYWQILISSDDAQKISKFLKKYLKDFAHSGIIVTVDIDPI